MEFLLENVDYKGRVFTSDVRVMRAPEKGPGWYIYARDRDSEVIKLVARPDVPMRKHPHYNVRVQRGWLRKRDAEFIASTGGFFTLHWIPKFIKGVNRYDPFCDLSSIRTTRIGLQRRRHPT